MESKKILISVPKSLISELDEFLINEPISRSEFIRKAIKNQLSLSKRKAIEKQLKKGYKAMGEINLSIAELGLNADNEQLLTYEQKLSESE